MDSVDGELIIFKNAFTLTIIGGVSYLGIDAIGFFLFGILLFFDYIVGIAVARKNNIFSKRQAVDGIIGKALLLIIPLALGVLARINGYDVTSVMSAIFGALSMAEFYSIIGGIYEYRTGKKRKEVDFTSIIINKLLQIIKGIIKNIINNK